VCVRVELAQTPDDARHPETLAQRQMPVAKERRGAGAEVRHPSVLRDHGKRETKASQRSCLPDALEEANVLRAASERHVLAVVGRRRRIALSLRERLHRAAQRGPRLQQADVMA
jgi:hypothetical protein